MSGTKYFYSIDHLGSVREMTNNSGTLHAEYGFDPFGRQIKILESSTPEFQYAGYYKHSASGQYLCMLRSYNPTLAIWTSRDSVLEEDDGNPYSYVFNNPISGVDSDGDWPFGLPGYDKCWKKTAQQLQLLLPDMGKQDAAALAKQICDCIGLKDLKKGADASDVDMSKVIEKVIKLSITKNDEKREKLKEEIRELTKNVPKDINSINDEHKAALGDLLSRVKSDSPYLETLRQMYPKTKK